MVMELQFNQDAAVSASLNPPPCLVSNKNHTDSVEVHYCVFTMQGKLMSFERSTDFSGIQDVSIRRSSSVVIQNLGKRDIK